MLHDCVPRRRFFPDILLAQTLARFMQVLEPGPDLMEYIVQQTVTCLVEIRQLPTQKDEPLPTITIALGDPDLDRNKVAQRLMPADGKDHLLLLTGMGGIGKTTLAKAVFNKLHGRDRTVPCCFLGLDPSMQSHEQFLPAHRALLQELAPEATFEDVAADPVLELLVARLRGKKVLVVVDNVWGHQLQSLLPGSIMEVLGEGSIVLVTSRDSRACDAMGAVWVQRWVVEQVEMECLKDGEAAELFCRHAFGTSSPPAGEETRVRQVVARCGGLPMAVEVVGRHRRSMDRQPHRGRKEVPWSFVYHNERAGRLEEPQTLFGAIDLSWRDLDGERKEALQDIVWFLNGSEWDLVRLYCGGDILEDLRSLALVAQVEDLSTGRQRQLVEVPNAITDFCKMAVRSCKGQRQDLRADELGAEPIWDELSTVCARLNVWHACPISLCADPFDPVPRSAVLRGCMCKGGSWMKKAALCCRSQLNPSWSR
jgi:hypothetical protein